MSIRAGRSRLPPSFTVFTTSWWALRSGAISMTVYEAHFGVRPSFASLVVGPFGCLAFVVLTPEQRSARGFDKSWSPKAIAGMFVGVWHNARKNIFHYLMYDGTRILETTSNIRLVGDCFPWKLQLERDGPIGLHPESDPLDGDDDNPSPAPCVMCGHVSSSNAYRCALQHQAHVEHGIAQRQVAFIQGYDPTIVSRFAASYNANMVQDRQERIQASRGIRPSLQRSLQQAPSGRLTDVFAIPATPDDPVPLDRPPGSFYSRGTSTVSVRQGHLLQRCEYSRLQRRQASSSKRASSLYPIRRQTDSEDVPSVFGVAV